MRSLNRWKKQLQKCSRKCRRAVNSRFKKRASRTGRFFILLSHRVFGALLQFDSNKGCIALKPIYIDSALRKQTTSKCIITKRKRKLLGALKVRAAKGFVKEYIAMVNEWNPFGEVPDPGGEPPILQCNQCEKRVTVALDLHTQQCTGKQQIRKAGSDYDSDSDNLVIDDDVELIYEGGQLPGTSFAASQQLVNLKQDPGEKKAVIVTQQQQQQQQQPEPQQKEDENEDGSHAFHCEHCGLFFSREAAFVAHQRISNCGNVSLLPDLKPLDQLVEPPTASCPIAYKSYDSVNNKGFTCRICSTIFPARGQLDRHIVTCHLLRVYQCYRCMAFFSSAAIILNHIKAAHMTFSQESGFTKAIGNLAAMSIYRCCFCKFLSSAESRVKSHIMDEHYSEFEANPSSNEQTPSPDSIENYLLQHIKVLNKPSGVPVRTFAVIVPDGAEERVIVNRRRQNDPAFPFRCARCSKRFSRK